MVIGADRTDSLVRMDVSAAEIVLGLVLTACAVAAAYGARWISRRSDEQMEKTRAALRSRHAVPDQPTRRVAPDRLNQQTRRVPPSPRPHAAVPAGAVPSDLVPDGPADVDPESSGRHRVPEELMRAVTYTLSPDRVARAKVPGPRPREVPEPGADRRG